MAKQEKYRINFISREGYIGIVSFYYEGYTGSVIELEGGQRPFVLREFNTEEDIYKPIRPQLAEIEIVTNSTGVSVDNFLSENESDIQVYFFYYTNSEVYWTGYVLQNDFQEEWQDQNHVIRITATDGFGLLKNVELSNNGNEILNASTPLQFIQYSTSQLALPWSQKYIVFNSLYHDSMVNTLPETCLTQCKISPKTFEKDPTVFDDGYTVLEKINTAFSQTIFMYRGMWYIVRIEDFYTDTSGQLRGFLYDNGTSYPLTKRHDLYIDTDLNTSNPKPIAPQMIRFVKRMTKEDIIEFPFERFAETIENSTFSRGTYIGATSVTKTYSISSWTPKRGVMTFANVGEFIKTEEFLNPNGPLVDTYGKIIQVQELDFIGDPQLQLAASKGINVVVGEKVNLSIDHKWKFNFTQNKTYKTIQVVIFVFVPGDFSRYYILNDEGKWTLLSQEIGMPYNGPAIETQYNGQGGVKPAEWNTNSVESESIPESGILYVHLLCPGDDLVPNQERYFKGFKFELTNRFDGYDLGLKSHEFRFTKDNNVKFDGKYQCVLGDVFSSAYKGMLFEDDETNGLIPTDNNWYRYRNSAERYSFQKQNAIGRWSHNRYNRTKIDGNFYGLTFQEQTGATSVIGLINTVRFLQDDPNKTYLIANMKEIDFANATWSATLEEVWDNNRDGGTINEFFQASVKPGTYPNKTTVNFLQGNSTDFLSTSDDKLIYKGPTQVNAQLSVSLSGEFLTTFPVAPPAFNMTFELRKNGIVIRSVIFPVNTNPQFFTVNLSPVGNTIINNNDEFQITYSSSITIIKINSGQFSYNTPIPNYINYNTYSEKYIYQ